MSRNYYDLEQVGKNMRRIRKKLGITVEQVREYLELECKQSIYKWERGECLPQADTLIALSLFYQVNPLEIFGEADKASSFFAYFPLFFRQNVITYK